MALASVSPVREQGRYRRGESLCRGRACAPLVSKRPWGAEGVSDGPAEKAGSPRGLRAAQLLRVRAVWITPALITSIFIALLTVFYVGSVVDPVASLRGLPVLVVNGDQGATVGSQHVNLGQDVVSALDHAPQVSGRLALDSVSLALP